MSDDDVTVDTDAGEATAKRPSGKRSSRASRASGQAVQTASTRTASRTAKVAAKAPARENIFKAVRRYLREVIAELRKVIWPNRKQMVTYTSVVLVFVVFMVAFISGLDLAFIKGVSWLFG